MPDRPVYSESMYPLLHYGWAALRAVHSKGFKLIDVPRPELYDLSRDPGEKQNLHQQEPQRAKELTVALADVRHSIERRKRPEATAAVKDEEALANLQSLGYLAGQSGAGPDDEKGRSRIDPKDRVQLHEKIIAAQGLLGDHNAAGARRLLEDVLGEDDAICDARAMLGEAEIEDHRIESAIPHFQRALALNPKHERSLLGLTKAYAGLGRYDAAVTGYQRIIELKGSDARASLSIADIYVKLGRFDDAAAALEQASAKGETSAFFINKSGEVRAEQGRDDEAVSLFERAVAADSRFALPHFNLGVIYEKRNNAPAAMEQYQQALKLEPDFCRAQFNLGRLYASMGDSPRARQLWEASLQTCPDFVQGHYYLAKLLMDSGGDMARAEKLVREGIDLDPAHAAGPLGYYVLADLLNRTGRSAEARKAMAKGREIQAAMK